MRKLPLGREADGGMCDGAVTTRCLMCYSDRRRGGASYFYMWASGEVGESQQTVNLSP